MGLLDVLLGRSKPAKPNLDKLFSLPNAALTLRASGGFEPTGYGAVCYRASEGAAFSDMQRDITELLDADDDPDVQLSQDSFGFTWLLCEHQPDEMPDLVTDLHAINTTLQDNGFGSSLLCSLVSFTSPEGQPLALVYLYKRGTFYPFAPDGDQRRDNALELQVRGLVEDDLPVESELGRWLAIWGAPGLG